MAGELAYLNYETNSLHMKVEFICFLIGFSFHLEVIMRQHIGVVASISINEVIEQLLLSRTSQACAKVVSTFTSRQEQHIGKLFFFS